VARRATFHHAGAQPLHRCDDAIRPTNRRSPGLHGRQRDRPTAVATLDQVGVQLHHFRSLLAYLI
jgi:hypothetical protein